MSKHVVPPVVLMAGFLFTANIVAGPWAPGQSAPEGREAFAGVWELNRERSDVPGDAARGSGGDPGPPGGKVIIGRGGGGGGVRIGGPGGGARGGSPDRMHALASYMRGLNEPPQRLTIVVEASSVGITSGDGRTELLQTDNKKVQARAENGLVKLTRRTRWDGHTLVAEIDVYGGPRIRRRYELADGGTELHITTEIRGGGGFGMGAAGQPRVLVYEQEAP